MPDPLRWRTDLEEDELYIRAIEASYFSSLSIPWLYTLQILDNSYENMKDAIAGLGKLLQQIGLPIKFDAEEALPSEAFWVKLRTYDADLFGNDWRPGISGDFSTDDIYDPDDIDSDGIYLEGDNKPDGYDAIDGANTLMIGLVIAVVLYFGGRDLVKLFKKTGGWVAGTAIAINAKMNHKDMVDSISDSELNIESLLADSNLMTELVQEQLDITHDTGMHVLEALKLLGVALDKNTKSSYNEFNEFVSNVDTVENGTI